MSTENETEDVKPETVESGDITGGLIQSNGNNGVLMFDRIQDPMAFAGHVGKAFAASGMFGCKNLAQGQVLALACILEKRNPLELMRTYHIISGKLSMRADAMLAEFRRRGGKIKWLKTGEDGLEARGKWSYDGNALEVGFTLAEAKRAGLVKAGGNWEKFPDAMLRARAISKAIRMIAPEIVAGCYAPEELGAGGNPESDVIEAEYVPLENTEKTPAVDFTAKTAAFVEPVATPAKAAQPAPAVATEQPQEAASTVDSLDSADEPPVEMVTAEQMETLRVFVTERLKMPIPKYKEVLAKRCTKDGQPVTSAKQLTREQADELLAGMGKLWERQKLQQGLAEMPQPRPITPKPVPTTATTATNGKPAGGSDPMSKWANGEPQEQPPFDTAASH